ncbi:MAG: SIMPL domain-containing protein [Gemmatimonadota bacterium]|nr:MAG: SIMPL domain-containing protein [Gemmatimonadota bacterium]
MDKNSSRGFAVSGIAIGLGIIIAGLSMSVAFYSTRATERYVTVKGLAERNVEADLAIWPLSFKETGNDLIALHGTVNSKRHTIQQFLLDVGFDESEMSLSPPSIRDSQAEPLYGEQAMPKFRYTAQQTMSVRTNKVPLVKQAMENSVELIGKGVVLVAGGNTEFLFTSLNEIKPDMIAEATKNAREAAEQFARDSGSKVGKIRKATQGLFSINVRDWNSPEQKVVRVVTTVEYYIKD